MAERTTTTTAAAVAAKENSFVDCFVILMAVSLRVVISYVRTCVHVWECAYIFSTQWLCNQIVLYDRHHHHRHWFGSVRVQVHGKYLYHSFGSFESRWRRRRKTGRKNVTHSLFLPLSLSFSPIDIPPPSVWRARALSPFSYSALPNRCFVV